MFRNNLLITLLVVCFFPLGACSKSGEQIAGSSGQKLQAVATVKSTSSSNVQGDTSVKNVVSGGKELESVIIKTNLGDIHIELNRGKAPISVDNFLQYVEDGFYEGTIFHRVIKGFMIQGGGFNTSLVKKQTRLAIKNEAANGLKNVRGTVAMARTSVVDSATSQFFINVVNNSFLNHNPRNYGYAVFGKVTKGMDVVDQIANLKRVKRKTFLDLPIQSVIIKTIELDR